MSTNEGAPHSEVQEKRERVLQELRDIEKELEGSHAARIIKAIYGLHSDDLDHIDREAERELHDQPDLKALSAVKKLIGSIPSETTN